MRKGLSWIIALGICAAIASGSWAQSPHRIADTPSANTSAEDVSAADDGASEAAQSPEAEESSAGAPAAGASSVAASSVTSDAIGRAASHRQAPKLVEFTLGAELVQNGVWDMNLNARGFNGNLGRRVAVRIDGRDPVEPFFGLREWAAITFPLDDLSEAELDRGSSSALYGGDASGGVFNLVRKRPRDSQGGKVRLAGGDQSSFRGDLRWAVELGERWYLKLLGGVATGDDFSVSRTVRGEYAALCDHDGQVGCLPRERVGVDPDDVELRYRSLRVDHYAGPLGFQATGGLFSLEAGDSDLDGPVVLTDLGRLQVQNARHPWVRARYSTERWNFHVSYKNREADQQLLLRTGDNLALNERAWKWEVATHREAFDGRARWSAGYIHRDERIDSADPTGPRRLTLLSVFSPEDNPRDRQTLLYEPQKVELDAFFGEVDWTLSERIELVLGARFDDSDLFDSRISPRLALVFDLAEGQNLRIAAHEGFQYPNYSEQFLQHDVDDLVQLSTLEDLCAIDGVPCGFDLDFSGGEDVSLDVTPETRVMALGNPNLEVEEVRSFELGYSLHRGGFDLALDLHHTEHEDFISDLVPAFDAGGNPLNPSFQPYTIPDGVDPGRQVQILQGLDDLLGGLRPFLTQNIDGTPILGLYTYVNLGDVETDGFDLGLSWDFSNGLGLAASYSWLDYDVSENRFGVDERLFSPNVAENRAKLGLSYVNERFNVGVDARWVDDFFWSSGFFHGAVDSYTAVDVGADISLTSHWRVGVHVSNAVDDEHFQAFGGDLLERRALANVSYEW